MIICIVVTSDIIIKKDKTFCLTALQYPNYVHMFTMVNGKYFGSNYQGKN